MLEIFESFAYTILTVGFISGLICYIIWGRWPNNNLDLEDQESKARPIFNLAFYVFVFYIITSIASSIMLGIYCAANGIDINTLNQSSELFDPNVYQQVSNALNPILQVVIYGIGIIGVGISSYKFVINDLKTFKARYLLYSLMGFGMLYGVNILSNILLQLIGVSPDSSNQEAIMDMIKSSKTSFLIISVVTVIVAPILEELVFRKSIFKLFKGNDRTALIVSAVCFGSIHVLSSAAVVFESLLQGSAGYYDLIVELIYLIPYTCMGIVIGFIYIKSEKNIITTIILHALNNFTGVAAIVLLQFFNEIIEKIGL